MFKCRYIGRLPYWQQTVCPMNDILLTSSTWQCRLHRVYIVSYLYIFYLVYIVDIAMLVNIESTSSILYVVNIVDIVNHANLADIEFKSFLTASILFKWLTSQCGRHWVNIVSTSFLSCSSSRLLWKLGQPASKTSRPQ